MKYYTAWVAYRLGDALEAINAPAFASGVDWVYRVLLLRDVAKGAIYGLLFAIVVFLTLGR